jgi:hypothetical protein
MDEAEHGGRPSLVVTSPGADQGRRIFLVKSETFVGRSESCDVRFTDPRVSRTHALLRQAQGGVYLEDIGSTVGTYVNEDRLSSSRRLRAGDVIDLGRVRLRFEGAGGGGSQTRVGAVPRVTPKNHERPATVRYDVDQQSAGTINNVGRDQYNSYLQQVTHQRDNFFREIAATRTKARYLIVIGFLMAIAGFGLFASGVIGFITAIPDAGLDSPPEFVTPFGRDLFGVPLGIIGWAMAVCGSVLIIVGIVLHVVATSRRKRVDRELPLPPPPWPHP